MGKADENVISQHFASRHERASKLSKVNSRAPPKRQSNISRKLRERPKSAWRKSVTTRATCNGARSDGSASLREARMLPEKMPKPKLTVYKPILMSCRSKSRHRAGPKVIIRHENKAWGGRFDELQSRLFTAIGDQIAGQPKRATTT